MDDKLIGIIDRNNYDKDWPMGQRKAVRGIIQRENNYALIYSRKYRDYKFPGGGMEEGESKEQTLLREVEEETGLLVIPATMQYFGKVIEYKKGQGGGNAMEQTSYYYFCQVSDILGVRNLEEYEKRFGYELQWVPLGIAIENNEFVNLQSGLAWIDRDTYVMKKIAQIQG